jgi:hypothetical protein
VTDNPFAKDFSIDFGPLAAPPPDEPTLPYVSIESLRAALRVPAGAQQDADLLASCVAATEIIETYCGTKFNPVPDRITIAALQIASRIYRSGDVVFGVLNTDLGSSFTGRWITPEIEALLIGKRKTFGIA